MTVLAVVHPSDIVAVDFREALDQRTDLWTDLRLLAATEEEVGLLTETRGAAAMVAAIDADSFDGVDVAFFFGPAETYRRHLETLPPSTRAVVVASGTESAAGRPVVADLQDLQDDPGDVLLSPDAGVVALAHLLAPLQEFGLSRAVATLLQPVSTWGKEGLDEMFEQTRDLLNFKPVESRSVLPGQLAFNVLHLRESAAAFEAQLREILAAGDEDGPVLALQTLHAGVFHGLGISLHVQLTRDPGIDGIYDALEASPRIEWPKARDPVGPTAAASRDEILIGNLAASGDGYAIWAVMDNLTAGGAHNAAAILESLVRPALH
ncbi:MAG: Asd/ArgC dimerization domain-containing protein [Acidobacteriota bacterium]